MKVRKNKHKILDRMANPSWKAHTDTMWFIRDARPCPSYDKGCPECNAVLFPKEHGRFPYTQQEWFNYLHKKATEESCSHGTIAS